MAELNVQKTPRFTGSNIAMVGGVAATVVVVAVAILVWASSLFDDTETTTTVTPTAPSAATSTSVATSETKTVTNDLVTAQFTITALVLFGGLLLVAGACVALTEVTAQEGTATVSDVAVEEDARREITGSAVSAVVLAFAEAAKALATALRGLKPSTALVLMGGLLMIMGGGVAWQTIPGTDRSPTIEVSETADTTTTTEPPAGNTTTSSSTSTSTLTTSTTRR